MSPHPHTLHSTLLKYRIKLIAPSNRISLSIFPQPKVALRTQMSTLKHNIRHQQAQLHSLENTLLRGPRPLPPGAFTSPPLSPADLIDSPPPSSFSNGHGSSRMSRRNSYEVLQTLAGPESSLPLPRRASRTFGEENGIKEGIPTEGSPSKQRAASPTRTLSRT